MSVQLTACRRANSDFPCPARKILIGPFSNRAGRTLHRPWNSMMRWEQHQEPQLIARMQSRLYDAEPDAEPWLNDYTEVLIERLHRSHGQSKSRIMPEPRYQHVTVTESSQSNVVKLEPSTGPTLFLIRTTNDRSTTATAIRIQYCASCMTRTDTAARKGPIQGQQHDIGKQPPRNGKAAYKETLIKMLRKRSDRAQLTTLSLNLLMRLKTGPSRIRIS